MKLINYKSRRGIVNLLADFIVKKIDSQKKSIIQVSDFGHFFIVNGKTESSEILDCSKLRDEFISENQELLKSLNLEQINIMDLIKYKVKDWNVEEINFSFFNSERPIYSPHLHNYNFVDSSIYSLEYKDDFFYECSFEDKKTDLKKTFSPLHLSSEFPHGYSLKTHRAIFYYLEYVVLNIKNTIPLYNKINIYLKNEKNSEKEINIDFKIDGEDNDQVKSLVLDLFDFEFEKFCEKLVNYNFCDDLIYPFKEKSWLIKNINEKDLVLI